MSRVDEALRRAAERAVENGAAVIDVAAGAGGVSAQDPAELAREPFPIEMPERRHIRVAAAAPAAAPVARSHFAAVSAESVREGPALPDAPKAGSLMERIDGTLAEKVVIDHNIMPESREQYRRLAATLHHAQTASGIKVVMIASAVPGEGKTLTAANLALTFSESYKRTVLLIDADLRRPAMHTVFRIDNTSGLTDGLLAPDERRLPVRQVSTRLAVLPAGRASSDPMAGLTSDRMRRLIEEARDAFDWVIIDTPPVGLLPDANLLAAMVDGAVVVVKAGSTSYDLVKRAVDAIGRQRILGVVLNRAASDSHGAGSKYYNHYYAAQPEAPHKS